MPHGEISSTGRTIAVVDDHADTAEALGLVLRTVGFRSAVFSNSLRFLAEFPDLRPDLVLLDLAMPECDGVETLRRLRRDLASDVRVIVISAQAAPPGEALAKLGVADILRKPFPIETLFATVDRVLGTAAGLEPAERLQHAAELPRR